jgi:hypothetical protein
MENILKKKTLDELYLELKNKKNKKINFMLLEELEYCNITVQVKMLFEENEYIFFVPTSLIYEVKHKFKIDTIETIRQILEYWRINNINESHICFSKSFTYFYNLNVLPVYL